MHRILPHLQTHFMFGVGAPFDFLTGHIHDCPTWVKSASPQWLDQLLKDLQRLRKLYGRNNSTFVWHMFLESSGLKTYPITYTALNLLSSDTAKTALQRIGSDR